MPVNLTDSIVQILRHDDAIVGTGFLISNNGLIATCAHVVQFAKVEPTGKLAVRFQQSREKHSASVIREYHRNPDAEDVAILKLEHEIPNDIKALPLGISSGTKNHEIVSFGFPSIGDIKGLWGHGKILGKVTKSGSLLLQIDSKEITLGFSGAPLWDEFKQQVVGMITIIANEDPYGRLQNTAFAIPTETLKEICQELILKIEDNHIISLEQIEWLQFENKRLKIEHIWSEFEHARIVGKYSLDQVLELLSRLKPPFSKWWKTKLVANFDVKDEYYQEMVRALEGIRNGNINQPFESYFGPGQELQEIFESQFPIVGDKFRTHLDELYEMILAPRISESYLQYYFYRHKKVSEEENVNDVIVNLIIIYLLTKYLDRWEWADCKLDRVVDCLIAQEEDIRSWI
jgi:hypothetical protein